MARGAGQPALWTVQLHLTITRPRALRFYIDVFKVVLHIVWAAWGAHFSQTRLSTALARMCHGCQDHSQKRWVPPVLHIIHELLSRH